MPSPDPLRAHLGDLPIRTRFAPSITGHLHLGHAVNAVYVWGMARALGGEVVIRLEDHDRGRYRPAYEESILADLGWLGLGSPLPLSRQRDHQDRYLTASRRLSDSAQTFYCDCTRKSLAAGQGADQGEHTHYPGTCRSRGLAEGGGRSLRLRVDPGVEAFTDLRLGPMSQDPAVEGGDFVLRDGKGQWTYQHCVVADDLEEGITLVIRGEDILGSTGRQLRLARLLGRTIPPRYFHHPLVTDDQGKKLSKKEFARSLGDLRREGWTPERVLGEAAFLGGLCADRRPLKPAELETLFR